MFHSQQPASPKPASPPPVVERPPPRIAVRAPERIAPAPRKQARPQSQRQRDADIEALMGVALHALKKDPALGISTARGRPPAAAALFRASLPGAVMDQLGRTVLAAVAAWAEDLAYPVLVEKRIVSPPDGGAARLGLGKLSTAALCARLRTALETALSSPTPIDTLAASRSGVRYSPSEGTAFRALARAHFDKSPDPAAVARAVLAEHKSPREVVGAYWNQPVAMMIWLARLDVAAELLPESQVPGRGRPLREMLGPVLCDALAVPRADRAPVGRVLSAVYTERILSPQLAKAVHGPDRRVDVAATRAAYGEMVSGFKERVDAFVSTADAVLASDASSDASSDA